MLVLRGMHSARQTCRKLNNLTSKSFSSSTSSFSAPKTFPTRPASQEKTIVPANVAELIVRYPRHPLLQFFDRDSRVLPNTRSENENKSKDDEIAVLVPDPVPVENLMRRYRGGRSWSAVELRRKSSLELHQLWYLCLMELNKLATATAEINRKSRSIEAKESGYIGPIVKWKVTNTMTRIKFVLNERRNALLDAQNESLKGTLDASVKAGDKVVNKVVNKAVNKVVNKEEDIPEWKKIYLRKQRRRNDRMNLKIANKRLRDANHRKKGLNL